MINPPHEFWTIFHKYHSIEDPKYNHCDMSELVTMQVQVQKLKEMYPEIVDNEFYKKLKWGLSHSISAIKFRKV